MFSFVISSSSWYPVNHVHGSYVQVWKWLKTALYPKRHYILIKETKKVAISEALASRQTNLQIKTENKTFNWFWPFANILLRIWRNYVFLGCPGHECLEIPHLLSKSSDLRLVVKLFKFWVNWLHLIQCDFAYNLKTRELLITVGMTMGWTRLILFSLSLCSG